MQTNQPLHRQIIRILSARKSAALVHSIASEVTVTRHEGRVHSALMELREAGVVTWCSNGWRLKQAEDCIEARRRAA
ncbi:hypothetical protein [Thioalkalivibrio sp. ALMg11]|uniref:hypothetical protein n=1 Tax=Thioalkalivibrio sp. ALMg11 TaxID=1158165 RepID=UPI0003619690|nr:hypothetical protein [Thioalkalivibrio sp. ALMg11]